MTPRAHRTLTILEAIDDDKLFGPWFRERDTWAAWFAFIAALFGLPMTDAQRAVYQQCTGRTEPPDTPATEAWLCIGRRGGKSFTLALVAVFLACFHDYRKFLAPGERGTVLVIAVDRRQARVIFRYVRALLTGVPMLARMIEREAAESFDLTNAVSVEVGSANFKSVVDCLREVTAPFDPETAVDEFARLFRSYGIRRTNGDRYAAAWCSQAFEKRRIEYRHSELPKSGLYLNFLPHVNGKTIRLLDDPLAVSQIASLERRTSRGGRDSVDHPPQGHDDVANAIAGLAYVAINRFVAPQPQFGFYSCNEIHIFSDLELRRRAR